MISRRPVLATVAAALAAAVFHPAMPRAATGDRRPLDHVIVIEKFQFVSDAGPILPGDTVMWINRDIVPHTATAADESWDTGNIAPGEQKAIRITAGLSPGYFCRFHPMMRSRLEIVEGR